jgi:hypothetical protein
VIPALAVVRPRVAKSFVHLDAAYRLLRQKQRAGFDPTLLLRWHLHSLLFEDTIIMDCARSVDYDGSGYFMTHAAFYIMSSGRYDLIPPVYNFLEAILPYQLAARNVEVVGEIAFVLQTIGRKPETCPALASCYRMILETAGPDANWPERFFMHIAPYKMLHVPWAALQGIPRRQCKPNERMVAILKAIPEWPGVLAKLAPEATLGS